uniref:Uncharacterized protein n=1 Tax=Skeletonema marinoi TaxID=267567 RepID=A0A7S2L1D1_9STRA|mmetsp:Transcript_19603/g.33155  ORF Transcript_19603/g.33155 Transcript_19603/m.33155 type:complete len:157 (+) Transcript_19603:192-662(+)
MKNYKELSTVVLFAILVHSALTASLVNIFMTLHGVGGGGDGMESWSSDSDLYFSDALSGSENRHDVSSSSTTTSRGDDSWLISSCTDSSSSSCNVPQQQSLAKKKIVSDDNISLETYSAMLTKHRLNEVGGGDDAAAETIESLRRRAKQSKFRYMR